MSSKQKPQDQQPTADEEQLTPEARITQQLVRQLKPHLPINSVAALATNMDHIEVERHRLPVTLFTPYISEDILPITTAEDLEQKLSDGVRRAVALANSGYIPVGNPSLIEILSTTSGEPRAYVSQTFPIRNLYSYDATPTAASTTDTPAQGQGGE